MYSPVSRSSSSAAASSSRCCASAALTASFQSACVRNLIGSLIISACFNSAAETCVRTLLANRLRFGRCSVWGVAVNSMMHDGLNRARVSKESGGRPAEPNWGAVGGAQWGAVRGPAACNPPPFQGGVGGGSAVDDRPQAPGRHVLSDALIHFHEHKAAAPPHRVCSSLTQHGR